MHHPRSDMPVGKRGSWILEHFEVPAPPHDDDARPEWARTPPGRYTRLRDGSTVMMTDTRDEWWTQRVPIDEARRRGGEVLVTGLGLGVVAESMLLDPGGVERVTVLEAAAEVIELVAGHLLARYPGRLHIEHADAFAWEPPAGSHFTVGWHDIWPNPFDADAAAEAAVLERRYAPYCDWQRSWTSECRRDVQWAPDA